MSKTGGRAHPATPQSESERFAAAERLGELIEQREALLSRVAQIEADMAACEKMVRSFDA